MLSEYEVEVHSPSLAFRLPSVIALKEFIPAARRPAFTRFNVFLRDRFECQYCGEGRPTPELTFDHVVPRSRGGRTSHASRRPGSCRTMGGGFRRTTCTSPGGTTCIGILNWRADRTAGSDCSATWRRRLTIGTVGAQREVVLERGESIWNLVLPPIAKIGSLCGW